MAIIQHLIVDEFGSFIGKKSERLQVTCQGEKRVEAPIMHLETVLITGKGVSLSSDAVAACAEAGIPIHFLDTRGHPVGSLYSAALTATIATRRAQLQARDNDKGLAFAKGIAEGKLRNQSNLLKYLSKNRREKQPELYTEVRLLADEVLDHLAELERVQAMDPAQHATVVGAGAVVHTDQRNFFVGASLDEFDAMGRRYLGVTPMAPVIHALLGRKVGEQATVGGVTYTIEAVF